MTSVKGFCKEMSNILIAANLGFPHSNDNQVNGSIKNIVTYIGGFPENHPRHSITIEKAKNGVVGTLEFFDLSIHIMIPRLMNMIMAIT